MSTQKPSLEELGLEVEVPPIKDITPLTAEDVQFAGEHKPAPRREPSKAIVRPPVPQKSIAKVRTEVSADIPKLWAWLADMFVGHAIGIGFMGCAISIDSWFYKTTRVLNDTEILVEVHQLHQITGLLVGIGLILVASLFLIAGVGLVVAASNRADADGIKRDKRNLWLRIVLLLLTLLVYAASIVVGPFVVVLFAFLVLAVCTTQCVLYQSV